jgi:two-component system, response regulator, stage 0 sporulation protein F
LPDAVDQLAPAVLVVDDDEGMRSLLRRMLERAGFAVVTAAHGREALERIRMRVIDVVITDMVMPEMDGIELTRALVAEYPGLPIIAISGVHDWSNYFRIAIRFGAKAGLQKPVSAVALIQAVREQLPASRKPR